MILFLLASCGIRFNRSDTAQRALLEREAKQEWADAIANESDQDGAKMNEELEFEHEAALRLVSYKNMTALAISSGNWSDPTIWFEKKVPTDGARIWVMPGREVVFDKFETARYQTIRVNGTLSFSPSMDTQLLVDTIVVDPMGTLNSGTSSDPIEDDKTAKIIIIADSGKIDRDLDPLAIGRGLIAHGRLTFVGARKTGHVAVVGNLPAGATQITLESQPIGWRVGDHVVLTGSHYGEDEELPIKSISDMAIEVPAIRFAHSIAAEEKSYLGMRQKLYVANLTRNISIQSENYVPLESRGHFMMMHSPKAQIRYAQFLGLGRSDRRIRVNDPQVDSEGKLIAGTGTNPRGRYSIHFHRTGVDKIYPPAVLEGSVAIDSPGWQIVNHSSNVDMTDNVAFHAASGQFVTEAGDEIGSMINNIAIGTSGNGSPYAVSNEDRETTDFCHAGHGFWLEGPRIDFHHNIASGQKNSAFVVYPVGIRQGALGVTEFPVENLPDPSVAPGVATVPVASVDSSIHHLEAFASLNGIEYGNSAAKNNVIANAVLWNIPSTYGNKKRGQFSPNCANS